MKSISITLIVFMLFILPALSFAKDLQQDKAVENEIADGYEYEEAEFDDYPEYEEEEFREIYDPIEPWNRMVFTFNDTFYEYAFKPVAKSYNYVVPEGARISIRNFFDNIGTPVRLINNLLQFKIKETGVELARFGVNSTLGIVGLFDVAEKQLDLKKHEENFGQTLGGFGLGDGMYIVWPLIGPSSLLDTVGRLGDAAINPLNVIQNNEAFYALTAHEHLNSGSLKLNYYDELKEAAIDPYTAFKDASYQYRREQIKK